MNNLIFKPTSEKIISENYPYGFREKTTKTDYLEFNPKHGFRHCSTTVNPKTGRVNNPKKSTYYDVMLLATDENGHCKTVVLDFQNNERKNKTIDFLSNQDNFNLFSSEQMEYIYAVFLMNIKADIKCKCVYTGAKFEDLKPLFEKQIDIIMKGFKGPQVNWFPYIKFDWAAIESTKVEGFQPFKITQYSNLMS